MIQLLALKSKGKYRKAKDVNIKDGETNVLYYSAVTKQLLLLTWIHIS